MIEIKTNEWRIDFDNPVLLETEESVQIANELSSIRGNAPYLGGDSPRWRIGDFCYWVKRND